MPLNYTVSAIYDADPHRYRVLGVAGDPQWLAFCAAEYVRLRTQCVAPLGTVSLDGIEVLSTAEIRRRLADASIPIRRPGNFDVVRSDFGEVLAYVVLQQEFGTRFGYQGVRDRETVQLTARGIDVIGVEDGARPVLVIGEVKVSSESTSPPRVVDSAEDSLSSQHLAHLRDPQATAKKCWDKSRFASDRGVRDLFFLAAFLLEEERWDDLDVVSYCLLVRPESLHTVADFGTFRSAPAKFAPARVRFFVVCVPNGIEETVAAWHSAATELGLS